MKYIDSHSHIDHEKFDMDRDEVIKRIEENMEFAVNIGSDLESSQNSVKLAKENDCIYAVVGVHPIDIAQYSPEIEEKLEELAQEKKVLAIGEIGLDYHWMTTPKEQQQEGFRKQLELARKLKKPVVIHSRDAMEDTIKILDEYKDITGIFHCYPGSVESAKKLIDRFYLGIGGVVTFKNAKKLVEVVENIPLDRLVLETDCPYMAPTPLRGERNEPSYIKYIAEKIAQLKGITYEEVIECTNKNVKKAYNMGE